MCRVHNTCCLFYSVTTVFNAATTGPNTENIQRVFSHFRSLRIIRASSPEDQPGLPLSVETCSSQSALLLANKTDAVEQGPHEFTAGPNFLDGGILMNHSGYDWLSACQSP